MYCGRCGSTVPNGSPYCPRCGYQMYTGRALVPVQRATQPAGAYRTSPVKSMMRANAPYIAAIAVLLVILAGACVYVVMASGILAPRTADVATGTSAVQTVAQHSTEEARADSDTHEAPSTHTAKPDATGTSTSTHGSNTSSGSFAMVIPASGESTFLAADGIRVELPEKMHRLGFEWEQRGHKFCFMYGNTVCATVAWGDEATEQDEASGNAYRLTLDSGDLAVLNTYYLDDVQAKQGAKETKQALSVKQVGVETQDVAELVSFLQGDSYVQVKMALIDETTTSAQKNAELGGTFDEPFWGVWIGAFKSQDAAQELAGEALQLGLPASVFYTTDWKGLNDEPYYVVSVGASESQDDAKALLQKAAAAGYDDAYVKYSGKHAE